MSAKTIIKEATAEGVSFDVSEVGIVRIRGEASTVRRWIPTIRAYKACIVSALKGAATEPNPRIDELRQLLKALLWDDPHAVEPEIERTLAEDAVDDALKMYRRLVADYSRLGELPTTLREVHTPPSSSTAKLRHADL